MSFILHMNGVDICSLEELKQNLDIEKLLEHRHNFHKWLFGEDYEEQALAVRKIDANLTDEQWLNEVGKICGFASELKKKEVSIAKKNVLEKYLQLEKIFEDFKSKIKKLDRNHPSTRELQEKFKAKLSEMIIACENEKDVVENNIEWDKLVIAFWGETNAGKSTIIDTFNQKILSIANRAQQGLLSEESNNIAEIKNQLTTFKNDVAKIFSKAKENLKSKSINIIEENINEFKKDAFSQISDNYENSHSCISRIKKIAKKMQSELQNKTSELFDSEIERIVKTIDRKKKKIDNIKINYSPSNIEYIIDVDCKSIDELYWNDDDIGALVGSAAGGAAAGAAIGSFVPLVGTLVGAMIGGAVGGLGNLVSDTKSKEIASAKNLFSQQIKIIKKDITKNMNDTISKIFSSLDDEKEKINSLIEKENESLNDLDNLVFKINKSLNTFINQL